MIMDSRASLASQESRNEMKMISPRKRPLHTCVVTILVIADRAFTKAQGLNGLLGFIINFAARVATLFGPLAYALQYRWITMAILSFIDNRILALEGMIERYYPPSHVVFNKIDHLVQVTETLPGKFDNVVSKFHFPFWDWTLVRAISLLNFVVATLNYWRMSKGTSKEKEIKVDTSSNVDRNKEHEPRFVHHEANRPNKPPLGTKNINNNNNSIGAVGGDDQTENKSEYNITPNRHIGGGAAKGITYKDVLLQKGTNKGGTTGKTEENDNNKSFNNNNKEEVESSVADDDESEKNYSRDDPLLELFESAWLMTSPGRNVNTRNYAPRSVSFTF